MRQLGNFSTKLMRKAAARRGFAEAELLANWHRIVPSFADFSRPIKMWQGALTVAVNSSSAAMNMQMQMPMILSKVNQYLGYSAVHKITFTQAAFKLEKDESVVQIVADAGAKVRAKARCGEVSDEQIREALEGLGSLVEMENMNKFKKKK